MSVVVASAPPSDLLGVDQRQKVDSFIDSLTHGKLTEKGSIAVASSALSILRLLVEDCHWQSAQELMTLVRNEGRSLISRCSQRAPAAVIGNMIRRVLKLVREEASSSGEDEEADSLRMSVAVKLRHDSLRPIDELKLRLLDGLEELSTELEVASEEIAEQALQHIHANEVILTSGRSRTVEQFLKTAAAKGRQFQVIVAESAPYYHGQRMATSLAASKIQTTVISDSAVFAVMSRVNKVIIGTHAILANGGLKAVTGTHVLALAAKHYSVPVIVCASMHKLTPKHCASFDNEAFSQFASPQQSLLGVDGKILSMLHTYNPIFEYVPPELVTLFISNMSGHAPSYVYRLLSELYHPDDYEL
jgi:translation initiation factor eIF-2B subunit beta